MSSFFFCAAFLTRRGFGLGDLPGLWWIRQIRLFPPPQRWPPDQILQPPQAVSPLGEPTRDMRSFTDDYRWSLKLSAAESLASCMFEITHVVKENLEYVAMTSVCVKASITAHQFQQSVNNYSLKLVKLGIRYHPETQGTVLVYLCIETKIFNTELCCRDFSFQMVLMIHQ